MTISAIKIRNLRIIEALAMEPGPGINLLVGGNGAGKTSVLEAIYLVSRGRSFRSLAIAPVIRAGAECVEVVASRSDGSSITAGIRRCNGESEIRVNGKPTKKLSELARLFPVQLVTPRSHELFEQGPDHRRRFLDWGLFHVEPGYHEIIQRYQRALRQRNQALKSRETKSLGAWDEQLAKAGEDIQTLRSRYVETLQEAVDDVRICLGLEEDIQLSLYPGWPRGTSLAEDLGRKQLHDAERGFTSVGPHRADLRIKSEGVPAGDRLSRGRQKLAVLSLLLGQTQKVADNTGLSAALLIDDLAAELDEATVARVVDYLSAFDGQVFMSALLESRLGKLPGTTKVFHVEQGHLTRAGD